MSSFPLYLNIMDDFLSLEVEDRPSHSFCDKHLFFCIIYIHSLLKSSHTYIIDTCKLDGLSC